MLVIGYGRIGTRVARLCAAFGMRVMVHDPNFPTPRIAADGHIPAPDWKAALPEADVVTLHCPLHEGTHHLINADAFARMKKGVWLVNTARGPVVEEAALVDGASRLRVFWEIVLPTAWPGIVAAAIFTLIVSWNDYLFGRVFMNSMENLPLTVGVMHFFDGTHVDWGLMMASSVLMTVPMALLFMLLQRHLVAGFGAGAVKG